MASNESTGKKVFRKIFGDKADNIESMLHDLSPELARLGIDFSFGEFYVHDDLLDLKSRELITISTFVTQGTLPQLKIHLQAALKVGCPISELEQAILQLIIYVSMPKVINAMKILKEVKEDI